MSTLYIQRAYDLTRLRELERQRRRYQPDLADEDDTFDDVRDIEYYGDPWRGTGPRAGQRGPYAGYGPRGYLRSDARIQEEVCDLLTAHGGIDATDIEVSVQDGEVTLQGTVDSRETKRMAGQAVDSIYGVRDVHNELRIRRPGMDK